jgi:hypothetical protein
MHERGRERERGSQLTTWICISQTFFINQDISPYATEKNS